MNRRGATIVALGLLLLPQMLLSVLFLDLSKVYVLRNEAQVAADAAALAGSSGVLDGEGEGVVVARVHHYVNDNPVGSGKAAVDSIIIKMGTAAVRVVLGCETGPLLMAESGLRLQAQAGAQVVDAAPVGGLEPEKGSFEPEIGAPTKQLRLVR